jgi:FKBP-type peptidyl-prolyl cis-trans isomerase
MTKYVAIIAIILALAAVFAVAQSAAKKPATPNTAAPTKVTGDGVKTSSGLIYWDIRVGTGQTAKEGSHVRVHYTGWLTHREEVRQLGGCG